MKKILIFSILILSFFITAKAQALALKRQINENAENTKVKEETFLLKRIGVESQELVILSLDEAIRKALENNNEIEVAKSDVKLQEMQLRSLFGTFDPVFTVSPQFTKTSTTGSRPTNDFRINAGMTKFFRYGGGNYRVFFNNIRTENTFSQAQISSGAASGTGILYSSSLGVTVTQPLWRNFKIDSARKQLKIQRKRLAQSDADFRQQVIEIISRVQKAYWDLVFALRDQQNKVANLNLSKENLRQIEAKIKAGTVAPIAKAEVETEIANREAEVLVATQQVSIAENNLKALIFKDANSPDWLKSLIPTDQPDFNESETISLQEAINQALENRPELKRLKLELETNEIDVEFFKDQTRPQIDFVVTASLNGFSAGNVNTNPQTIPLISGNPATNANAFLLQQINSIRSTLNLPPVSSPNVLVSGTPDFFAGGFNRSLSNMFRSDALNYTVGLTISFPFRNETAEANLAGAKIARQRLEAQIRNLKQNIIAEVRNAVQAVETARQRVIAARRARENAEIQLEGERKLFQTGRSTTFLLFQRENALANARNAEIRAETDYKKALADLQRVTSTTLQANNIQIEPPMDKQ